MSELQNQLKNQDLNLLLASSIKEVGGVVFPDNHADVDLEAFARIVTSWRDVHVPTAGNPIPNTGLITTLTGSKETAISPIDNSIYQLQAISFVNTGTSAPISASITLGGFPIQLDSQQSLGSFSVPPGSIAITLNTNYFFDKGLPLGVVVNSGNASDLQTKILTMQTAQ